MRTGTRSFLFPVFCSSSAWMRRFRCNLLFSILRLSSDRKTCLVCWAYTNNILGVRNIPLESVKFHGPAANGVRFLRQLRENGYKDSNGVATTLFLASNNTDPVGSGVGANPTTAGTCVGLPSGKCYNHSSYNGWETIDKYLRDGQGQKIQDRKTGEYIVNPEFRKIEETVEPLKEQDGTDRFRNPTLPKILTQGADGNLYAIDRFGNVSVYDPKTLDKIEGVKPPQATKIRINGTDYFDFQGRRYHAKPFN